MKRGIFIHRIASALALLFALVAQTAHAFIDPPWITPAAPMAGETVSVNIRMGICDAIFERPGYPQITQAGNAIRILEYGHHWDDDALCIYYVGTTTEPIGTFPPGDYVMTVDFLYDDLAFGYTIMNDVSALCLQAQGLLTIAKGFETFCPIGPWMVTKDEIPDPQDLTVRTFLNDLEVCKAHTSEMLFSIRQFIASLSRVFPLEPGDVLATGSPPGPGMYHDPPILAKVGDVMRIEIEKIGTLANPVVAATR